MANWKFLVDRTTELEGIWPQGALWPSYIRYAFDTISNKNEYLGCLRTFEREIEPLFSSVDDFGIPAHCGRLSSSLEGGGKRRIFAIGNYLNQRLLKPLHDWLMQVLRRLPMDGTFQLTYLTHSTALFAALLAWPGRIRRRR